MLSTVNQLHIQYQVVRGGGGGEGGGGGGGGGGVSLVYLGSTYRPQGVTRHWHSPKYHHE